MDRSTISWFLVLTIVLFHCPFSTQAEEPDCIPLATLATGLLVEGFRVTTTLGAAAKVFLGVPYAQAPLGPLRFKKPKPLENYSTSTSSNRISCRSYKPSCWQNHSHVERPITDLSEDCLYLNIFAGYSCQNTSKCPVVYYIHGGGFEFDSPSLFPVETLVENFATHGLVFVTVAYRLGVMGFWSLGSEEATGNYALHDAIQGLRWVQQEIEAFGGDPGHVTVMGHSTGASIVSLLTLTSETDGLFHAAVIMSATGLLRNDLTRYRRLAEDTGCARKLDWISDHKYDRKIVECMQRVPADVLINTYRFYEDSSPDGGGYGMGHTMPLLDGPNGLFPEPLIELMTKRRPIDIMIGTVKNEIGDQVEFDINATISSLSELCKTFIDASSVTRNRHLLTYQCQRHYVSGALEDVSRNHSQENRKFSVWTVKSMDIKNDFYFFAPIFKEASSVAKTGANVYLYNFDYVKKGLEGLAPWHSFDLTYLTGLHPFQFDDRDYAIKSIYVPLFVNFAKFGNPTPRSPTQASNEDVWAPLRTPPLSMNYLSVDLPKAAMKKGYHYEGVLFWDYIVPSLGTSGKSSVQKRFLNMLTKNGTDIKESEESDSQSIDWYLAFWITLSITFLVLLSLGITAVVMTRKRRTWRWSVRCRICYRKPKKAEEETLLASMKSADSYSTFY